MPRSPLLLVFLASLTAFLPSRAEAYSAALPSLGEDLAELRSAFVAADGKLRLLVVTAERDRRALALARSIREEVLPEISDVDLQVFVVWVPSKGKGRETTARKRAWSIAEPRLTSFWCDDPARLAPWRDRLVEGTEIETKSLPANSLPAHGWVALYPPTASSDELPPAPAFWSHVDKKLARAHPAYAPASLREAIAEHGVEDPDDVAALPTVLRRAGNDPDMPYYLHGPRPGVKAPKEGRPLVVILPGGPGDKSFRPFVKRLALNSCPADAIVVQPFSRMWTPKQEIIWPTEKNKVTGQKFSTESYIDRVLEDVVKQVEVDRKRITLLGWSSAGPALYAHALGARPGELPVTRYFISQSIFRPHQLPDAKGVRGKRIYLHHSRTDPKCRFADAESALETLRAAGATMQLREYDGGHGWHGDMYGQVRAGLRWLDEK